MRDQRDRALAVVDAARAVHDGASVETRRAALERLGAALQAYDNGSGAEFNTMIALADEAGGVYNEGE